MREKSDIQVVPLGFNIECLKPNQKIPIPT